MKSLLIKIFLFALLFLLPLQVLAQNVSPTVISVGDGDTLRIREAGQVTTIRLGCIDAPERAQSPWGQQSTSRLKQLLPLDTIVQIRKIDRDRYGRTVAELFIGNKSINLQMVKDGQAVVYRQYLNGCEATKDQYLQAEAQAKQKQLGYWNQKSPVMPWDYRRGKRRGNSQSVTKVPPNVATQKLPSCTNSNCNCRDFKTQVQAQQFLNAFPGDKFRLDRNADEIACESLP